MDAQPRCRLPAPPLRGRHLGGVCLLVAAASLLVPAAPGYDPWSWLIWGREVAHLDLDTDAGPAWKPLPVAVTALLSPLGSAAPEAWLLVARLGSVLAILQAARLARRLGGGSASAGLAAGGGVLLCGGFIAHAGVGDAEGALLGLALVAVERALDGHHRSALALSVGVALIRTEAWPFLLLYGALLWRQPGLRGPMLLAVLGVPAAWFLPELWGSGDLLRSSARARTPNPGAPALAEHPALEALSRAVRLPLPPLWAGAGIAFALAARGRLPRVAVVPAAAGLAWIALVSAMSEAGFSGEERYHLPGAAAIAVTGAVGLARLASVAGERRGVAAAVALAVLASVGLRLEASARELDRLGRADRVERDLSQAVRRAGGAEALRRCGAVYTGPRRGPIVAWHLGAHKDQVGFDPVAPGVVLRSRLRPSAPVTPALPGGFSRLIEVGEWEVAIACRVGRTR